VGGDESTSARRRAPGTNFSKPRASRCCRSRLPTHHPDLWTRARNSRITNASVRTCARAAHLGAPARSARRRTPSRSPRALERGFLSDFPPGTPRVSAASSPRSSAATRVNPKAFERGARARRDDDAERRSGASVDARRARRLARGSLDAASVADPGRAARTRRAPSPAPRLARARPRPSHPRFARRVFLLLLLLLFFATVVHARRRPPPPPRSGPRRDRLPRARGEGSRAGPGF